MKTFVTDVKLCRNTCTTHQSEAMKITVRIIPITNNNIVTIKNCTCPDI
jgi:abortive infection bacteriophage resistance protein